MPVVLTTSVDALRPPSFEYVSMLTSLKAVEGTHHWQKSSEFKKEFAKLCRHSALTSRAAGQLTKKCFMPQHFGGGRQAYVDA
ncbi:hypothetical protein NMY22_g17291 [Coprinellus aureogranulatus]|nr:hypothetical protein NMY22_g17291 [Coprinellus aureogranulatus]